MYTSPDIVIILIVVPACLHGLAAILSIYSGASLIRTPLIRMLHYPDDISGNKLHENLSNVIHLSERFVYPDDFAGNQSIRINEARLHSHETLECMLIVNILLIYMYVVQKQMESL
jgi:hypothetical protein